MEENLKLEESQEALLQNVDTANEVSRELNGKPIMKAEVKTIKRAMPDGMKQKRAR